MGVVSLKVIVTLCVADLNANVERDERVNGLRCTIYKYLQCWLDSVPCYRPLMDCIITFVTVLAILSEL